MALGVATRASRLANGATTKREALTFPRPPSLLSFPSTGSTLKSQHTMDLQVRWRRGEARGRERERQRGTAFSAGREATRRRLPTFPHLPHPPLLPTHPHPQDVFAAWDAPVATADASLKPTAAVARAPSFTLRADCYAPPAPSAPFCARPGATTPSGGGASDATAIMAPSPVRSARRRQRSGGASPASRAPRARTAAPGPSPLSIAAPAGYDFVTVYAFLGALFDPACASVDVPAALAAMGEADRAVALLWARSLATHLRSPGSMAAAAAALAEAGALDEAR